MTRTPGILAALLLVAATASADSADINLAAVSWQTFSGGFALSNAGPDAARDVVVTIDLPPQLTVTRASVDTNECDISRRPIRCELAELPVTVLDGPDNSVYPRYGGIDVTGPMANAAYEVTFTVTSSTPDPNPANNSKSITWETRVESDLGVSLQAHTERVDPGDAGRFSAYICNDVRDNVPAAVRAELTLTNGVIESIEQPDGFTCTIDGATAVCTHPQLGHGCPNRAFDIGIRTSESRAAGEARLTVNVTSTNIPDRDPADNVQSAAVPIYRWLSVNTTADAGPGSLRQAIIDANTHCTPGPCRILFEIPGPVPPEGWFTIIPGEPLPAITAERVTLEGSRQTQLTGDTNPHGPEIAIDGRLARSGLKLLSKCEGVVEGLAIGNFDEDQGLWISTGDYCGRPDKRQVRDNHIGVDPSGTVPWPNLRGLRSDDAKFLFVEGNVISHNRNSGIWMWRGEASIRKNRIERNGASGIFLGPEILYAMIEENRINEHPQMGIALARSGNSIVIRRNSMKDNGGLGIDWGLDGVSAPNEEDHGAPTNAPVLLSARYDPAERVTRLTVNVTSTPLGPYFNFGTLDIYSNTRPDGDGERWLIDINTNTPLNGTATFVIGGDRRGEWINATWTRKHSYYARSPRDQSHENGFVAKTSELSNAVLVE